MLVGCPSASRVIEIEEIGVPVGPGCLSTALVRRFAASY
jgi:hypothetical protein